MKISALALSAFTLSPIPFALAQDTPFAPAPPVNLALNKKYVSSDVNMRDWGAGLTDGSWEAARTKTFATGDGKTFPKSVTIDLETPTLLGYVGIGVPPFGSTKTVKVTLSTDNTTFTEIGSYQFTQKQDEKHLFKFAPTTARYIRLIYSDHYPTRVDYAATYAFTCEVVAYAPGVEPILPPDSAPLPFQPADVPAPKLAATDVIQPTFQRQHKSFLQRAKAGPVDLLFLGDSITEGWRTSTVQPIWNRYNKYNAANFGIGGDRTQHVLWRIENGELEGINPKVVVLLIGTNNTGSYTSEDIVKGDAKIVSEIHRLLPNSKVLLLGIFPRSANASDNIRFKIKGINAELAKLDDGKQTRFLDLGDKLLTPDGELTKEIMYDYLHPTPAGYRIWADAMQPILDEMMK